MSLRKHQKSFKTTIHNIIAGSGVTQILVHVTPGGGKSALPIIAGELIPAGLADALCWVVPRTSLQTQGERNFIDPFFRSLLGHDLMIRSSTNQLNPCRGLNGFATTYQAISMDDQRRVLRELGCKRYILILDEFHHVEKDGEWFKALAPIVEKASFLILMTGTLERGDGKPIAWMDYERRQPVVENRGIREVIRYDRSAALAERAILPIEFTLADGQVEWETRNGDHKVGLLSDRISDAGQALFTALATEFSDTLLDKAVNHWVDHNYVPGKLLVVAADFEHAKAITARLKRQKLPAKIATSHDTPKAVRNINEFKYGRLDILVSIAMAYEGLDCPQISHIACLTRIRSKPWIEQCIARAVRINPQAGPYERQRAYIFAPDDFFFRSVVDQIKTDQAPFIVQPQAGERQEREGGEEGEGQEPDVIPLGSILTGERSFSIGHISAMPNFPEVPQAPSDQEQTLREQIAEHVSDFAFKNWYRPERINSEIKGAFGKPRGEMTLSELRSTLDFVRQAYPLNGGKSLVPQVSQPRGNGLRKRVKPQVTIIPRQESLWG